MIMSRLLVLCSMILPPEFVDGRLLLLVELLEPDTFSTWFGKIRLDVKLFNDFNLAIEIPYLFEIAHT